MRHIRHHHSRIIVKQPPRSNAQNNTRDLLEILDDRFGHRSVIVTSQLPVADWHRQVKDLSVADAILDRLVHGAIRFELSGSSMRNPTTCERSSTAGGQQAPART